MISLTNNLLVNNDSTGVLLRAESAAWGKSGSNGGKVTFNLSRQAAEGDIVADSVSTVAMTLADGSSYKGTINGANQAGKITLTLDEDSVVVLTGDSYVDSLSNALSDNSNIYLNGYTLYVGGTALSANDGTAPEVTAAADAGATGTAQTVSQSDSGDYTMVLVIAGLVILLAAAGCTGYFILKGRKDKTAAK